jgi:hypothetical protein
MADLRLVDRPRELLLVEDLGDVDEGARHSRDR